MQPDIATPAVLEWSLRIEQEIAPRTSLTVGYVGSHSYHQILSEDMNEPVPTYLAGRHGVLSRQARRMRIPSLANSTSWVSQGVGSTTRWWWMCGARLRNGFQFRGNYTYARISTTARRGTPA